MHAHSKLFKLHAFYSNKYGSITLPYKVWNTEAAIDGQHTVEHLSTHSLPTINFILSLYPQTSAQRETNQTTYMYVVTTNMISLSTSTKTYFINDWQLVFSV